MVLVKQFLGKVDVDMEFDICNVSDNTQDCFQVNGIKHQEQYAGGEFLETFAPAWPLLLTTI